MSCYDGHDLKDFWRKLSFLEKTEKEKSSNDKWKCEWCQSPLIILQCSFLLSSRDAFRFSSFTSSFSQFQLVETSTKIKQSITIHKWIHILILTCEVSIIFSHSLVPSGSCNIFFMYWKNYFRYMTGSCFNELSK